MVNKKEAILCVKGGSNEVQIEDRLQYNPKVYEIHLNEDDLFGEKYLKLRKNIEFLQSRGIKVFLHQPMKIRDKFVHINKIDCNEEYYLNLTTSLLIDLCKEYNVRCVTHFNYGTNQDKVIDEATFCNKEDYINLVANSIKFLNKFDPERKYLMMENGVLGTGGYRKDMFLANLIKDTSIPLCIDISHLAISLNEHLEGVSFESREAELKELNDYIFETLTILKDNTVYYHVVDSLATNGLHDGLSLGEGVVDWGRIKDLILEKDYIYEIGLKDITNCIEMLESHNYFKKLN